MPRDLWYRIAYSQALEQQLGKNNHRKSFPLHLIDYLGSGEAFVPEIQSSKRKHKEGSFI